MKRVAYSNKTSDTASAMAKGKSKAFPFHNQKLLREILKSRPDIDWANASVRAILKEKIEHPYFEGSVAKLLHRAFGLTSAHYSQVKCREDLSMFLWFAMEDDMIAADQEMLEKSGIGTISDSIGSISPERILELEEGIERGEIPQKKKKRPKKPRGPPVGFSQETVREILDSRPDIDWVNTPVVELRGEKIRHPEFSGTLSTLFYHTFGVRSNKRGRAAYVDDMRMLIWFAMEDEMNEADDERLGRSFLGQRAEKVARLSPEQFLEFEPQQDISRIPPQIAKAMALTEEEEETLGGQFRLLLAAIDVVENLAKMGLNINTEQAIGEIKRIARKYEKESEGS